MAANAALFIGWGQAIPGREQKALQVFNEGIQYWSKLQQQGMIESFEPFLLEPHGGDLLGFCLLRGQHETLSQLRTTPEFLQLNARAGLVVANLGVVSAFTGEALNQQFAEFGQFAAELA
jgi:hypothetical protein